MPNLSTSLFGTSASLELSNRFETPSTLSEPDSLVPDNIAPPPHQAASSPIVQQEEAKTKTKKAVLNQSIKNKKAEIHSVIDTAKPDIILGKKSSEVKNSEMLPDSFAAIRKDRASDGQGGGVFIAYRRDLLCTETPELNAKC